jgi:hypothetical protein
MIQKHRLSSYATMQFSCSSASKLWLRAETQTFPYIILTSPKNPLEISLATANMEVIGAIASFIAIGQAIESYPRVIAFLQGLKNPCKEVNLLAEEVCVPKQLTAPLQ